MQAIRKRRWLQSLYCICMTSYLKAHSECSYCKQASKHKNVSNLSHEVHRVGYHFPSIVVDKACTSLGVTLRSGQVVYNDRRSPVQQVPKPNSKTKKRKNPIGKRNISPQSGVSQATIDTEAREAIRDLFPNIPENDLYDIIRQAFSKVGG